VPYASDTDGLLVLAERLRGLRWVDLSHALEEGIPAWPTHARFGRTLYESYEYGDVARHYGLTLSEHTGTHVDAPLHFIQDGPAHYGVDTVPREAAEYLVGRGVALVGCDTVSVDAAASVESPAHYALLGSEVYVVENLKNLGTLPPFCLFVAFPLKIRGGSGSPVRAVALVPR
jgi:kynurenine formamidase